MDAWACGVSGRGQEVAGPRIGLVARPRGCRCGVRGQGSQCGRSWVRIDRLSGSVETLKRSRLSASASFTLPSCVPRTPTGPCIVLGRRASGYGTTCQTRGASSLPGRTPACPATWKTPRPGTAPRRDPRWVQACGLRFLFGAPTQRLCTVWQGR